MTLRRLTKIAEAVRIWDFFQKGILYEAKYLRYTHSLDVYRRILFSLIRNQECGWVVVAYSDEDPSVPVAFVLAHDATPLHSELREYEISMFYYLPGNKPAIREIQNRFDDFCRENGVHCYYLTTSSFSSAAERVFHDSWRGLVRSNTVFKRKIQLK